MTKLHYKDSSKDYFVVSYGDRDSYSRSVIPQIKKFAKEMAKRKMVLKQSNLTYSAIYNIDDSYEENGNNLIKVNMEYKFY